MAEFRPEVQATGGNGTPINYGGAVTRQRSAEANDAPSGRGGEAALGIYAVNYSTSTTARVSEDGEILDAPRDSRTARAERYALKSAARRLLPKDHRTTKCMHWRLPDREIQVQKGVTNDRAFYHGLQVCAMPWTCPVCASKISERRRHEVAKAMKQAEALGLKVFLITPTVPHGLGDDVGKIVDQMSKAWKWLWQGRRGIERGHGPANRKDRAMGTVGGG